MPPFAAQQSLFRAYDIRGSYKLFTPCFIEALGRAFATLYTANSNDQQQTHSKSLIIVIGHDVRCGSDRIAQGLAHILTRYGIQVIQLGLITTPMMAFWAQQYQGHGIVVTASHSAKDILGMKWLVDHKSPDSRQIQSLYQQLIINETKNRLNRQAHYPDQNTHLHTIESVVSQKPIDLTSEHVATAYMTAITQVFAKIYPSDKQADSHLTHKLDLVIVIDCMHGATSTLAQRLFERFCRQVIMLNDTPDGSFPTGNPDPTEPYRLIQLQQSVIAHHADLGMAFDGDGDRLMMVDNHGNIVSSDHLLYLLAQVALAERPQSLMDSRPTPQVLFDIKCSHHLPTLLSQLGSTPILSKTGSSFMRQRMQSADSPIIFAGELSGHFIFNDGHFIIYDDAMYAALRLLHWLAAIDSKDALVNITRSLPATVSTADHYLPMPNTADQGCPVVEQLARLCHYLRKLVATTTESDFGYYPLETCPPSLCECSTNTHHITLEQAQHLLPAGTKLSCIDGVRLDFAHGFGVLRQSNTSHNLTARFAGNTLADLKDIQAKFAALCRPFDRNLAEQIATMPAE
ncbi:phosphomannomutase [Psychrobacter alimentarius]|uniref:phosphomannomutase n=1 Tax=Psychrobacter alimentarius TaxID=261164 RepID=UPI003FD2B454